MSLALALPGPLLAAGTGITRPETVGLSSERLQRIDEMLQRHIEAKAISGAIAVVARKGRVAHFRTIGLMDIESKKPMTRDAVFRLASMTKPIIGVAIMILVEEGKVHVNDPVSRFIPQFKDMKVAVPNLSAAAPAAGAPDIAGVPFTTVAANREIMIRDLLTHTSGLVSGPISAQQALKVPRANTETLADYIPRLATIPLEFQPGTRWAYSPSAAFETLGRVIEVASGQSLDHFLRERIFEPLGMKDTYFGPPADRASRVASIYSKTGQGLEKQTVTDPRFLPGNAYFAGGGGLSSTADDYLQFALMLLNGGELNGKRLLGTRTLEWMRTEHLPAGLPGRRPGEGFGWSVRVIDGSGAGPTMLSPGSYGWSGAFGTHFWVDPQRQLVGLFMIQVQPNAELRPDFEAAVMQAVID
jgi:CubicO group peptidase (beta-lactamase class C family)